MVLSVLLCGSGWGGDCGWLVNGRSVVRWGRGDVNDDVECRSGGFALGSKVMMGFREGCQEGGHEQGNGKRR